MGAALTKRPWQCLILAVVGLFLIATTAVVSWLVLRPDTMRQFQTTIIAVNDSVPGVAGVA